MKPVKILIADDHAIVAESLGMLIDMQDNYEVIGIVSNGWQALNFIESNHIDIIIADLHIVEQAFSAFLLIFAMLM